MRCSPGWAGFGLCAVHNELVLSLAAFIAIGLDPAMHWLVRTVPGSVAGRKSRERGWRPLVVAGCFAS